MHPIGSPKISREVVDGPFGSDLKVDEYLPSPEGGIPLIRVSDCRTGQIAATNEMVFISKTKHAELIRSEVLPGDVLLTKAGAILGYSAVFPPTLKQGNITSHLAAIRPANGVVPQYLSEFLSNDIGNQQIYRWGNKSTRRELNTNEVRAIVVILAKTEKQRELAAAMDTARGARRAKLADADALVAGLEGFLLETLGLTPAPTDGRKIFAVQRASVPARFDPHFHLPAFAQNIAMLAAAGSEPLGALSSFSKETWRPEEHKAPTFRYIEISAVNTSTGEARAAEVAVGDAPSRARMALKERDIIVSLTRPHHGAIAQITPELEGCVASTGFAVLRDVNENRVSREYLWCALRSRVCLQQMLQRASGGYHPANPHTECARV